jgi:hypothetical protein
VHLSGRRGGGRNVLFMVYVPCFMVHGVGVRNAGLGFRV